MIYRILLIYYLLLITAVSSNAQDNLTGILVDLDAKVKEKGDAGIADSYALIRPRFVALSLDQKIALAELLMSMEDARLSLNPYYKSFFKAYSESANTDMPAETYDQWISVLRSMLAKGQDNRANKVKAFLDFSFEYFKDGSFNVSVGGTNWKALSFQEEIGFQENKPFLKFTEIDLLAFSKKDSIMIYQATGTYFPLESMWYGVSGIGEWPEGSDGPITVAFKDYQVDTKKSIYNVDEAYLTFEKYFKKNTIKGSFQDKLSNQSPKQHPVFKSEARDLVINDLGPNLSLRGSLELKGQKLLATGIRGDLASMHLRDESGKILFKLGSKTFVVQESNEISGKSMSATLYFDQDSIFHPSVNVKYDPVENSLRILRGESAIDAVPFFDSHHNFNIQVDEIKWYIGQDSLVFGEEKKGLSSDSKTMYFESPNYFSKREFNRMQSLSNVNPIIILKIMSEKGNTTVHNALDVAKRINPKYNLGNAQTLFYELVESGFINYDKTEEIIEVRDKVFHYADASRNRIDYDRLKITSKTAQNNATVDTESNIMTVTNVKGVELSPIHRVAMVPNENILKVMKDRSMGMDGLIYAGLASFEGKGFEFNYDKFSVQLDSVRYMDFFVPPSDGSKNPVGLSSRLENGSGTLLIDAPGNKSAQEIIPLFPSFTSNRPFSVFYDSAQDSSYARSAFYFQLDKFGFNGLDSFSIDDVQFKGKLFSQSIFEPFQETISVQIEDYSLGFVSSTDAAGKLVYKGKGTFFGDINLNSKGLTGIGKVKYLESELQADDIVFRPESLTGTSRDLNIIASSKVPQVISKDVLAEWVPYRDSMVYESQETPFSLYGDNKAALNGLLHLGLKGLTGEGVLDFDQGILTSNRIEFRTNTALVDTADLVIKAGEGEDLAFNTKNVAGELDFSNQVAKFKANSADISTELPYNKYKTSMNEFVWDINKKTVSFTSRGDVDAYFLSTDRAQDSLVFVGKAATYNIAESTLSVSGVDRIEVGDAIVEADNGEVNIEPGGPMQELENATIYIDKDQKQHQINKATVNITSRNSYTAKGEYAFDLGSRKQSVVLNNIIGKLDGKGLKSEQKSITKASGEIKESDNFYIDDKTRFSGSMSITGDSKDILFKGYAQLDAPLLQDKAWFSINSLGDKDDLRITYDEPKDKDGAPIRTGIYLSKESALAYPSIMYPLSFRKDRPIIDVRGQFKYEKSSDSFIFGDSLKLAGSTIQGNMLTFDNRTAEVFAEGVLNLCPKIRPITPIKTVGQIRTKYKTKETNQRWSEIPEADVIAYVMSSITIPIPKAMMDQMAVDFRSSTFGAAKPNYNGEDFYNYAISAFTKKQSQYDDAIAGIADNVISIPKAVDKSSFILGKMEMKWDPDYQSFVSKPGKVALVSIDGSPINIMIDVHVEYKMTTNEDDRLYVYLKSPSGLFYFFGMKGEVLNVTSDNTRFMKPLNEMKDKERIIKVNKQLSFELQGVTEGTANKFVQRARAAW